MTDRLAIWLAVLALAFSTLALTYSAGHKAGMLEYHKLAAVVEHQNKQAGETLAHLTAERDDLQAALDLFAKHQENKDAQALAEIERLGTELRNRPIRVRVVTEAGTCGGGSAGETAASSGSGGADAGPTDGVLPDANSRRLAAALKEVETLSAAYSSCRSMLYGERTGAHKL